LAIFFLLSSKKFLPISFKTQLLETSPQKQKEQRQKQLDVSFSNLFSLPVKETAEIETGMAEKSSWDQANIRKNQVWFGEIERKLAKLKTTFTYRSSC
jgi:hypothetical protein